MINRQFTQFNSLLLNLVTNYFKPSLTVKQNQQLICILFVFLFVRNFHEYITLDFCVNYTSQNKDCT